MKTKRHYIKLSENERRQIFHLWRKGYTYRQIAERHGTYRQKPRAVVLSFRPSFADYRCHDHYRRLNEQRRRNANNII